LTRQDLATLAKELEIAERNFPALGTAFTNEAALSGFAVDMPDLDAAVGGWLSLAREGGWRYGSSTRQMALDAFEQWDLYATRSHNIDKLPFDAATKEAQAITNEVEASMNPLVRMFVPNLSKAMMTHREALARLRLLRAATIILATGEMPELGDPFGKNLSFEKDGDKFKIWSNGRDGVNQNGQGSWSQTAGPDIVLEIAK
jgi:hypothetical protein